MVSSSTYFAFWGLIAVFSFLYSPVTQAGDVGGPVYITQSIVDRQALTATQGVMALNLAAGDANLQMNAAAIAINIKGDISLARVSGFQVNNTNRVTPADVSIIRINDGAFANATGLLSINQASGQGNLQANSIAIALGIEGGVISENTLAQIVTTSDPQSNAATSRGYTRKISVADDAFAGTRGIVQLNQSAGSRNATVNSFALRLRVRTDL